MLTSSAKIDPRVTLGNAGLLLGAETRLAQFVGDTDVLAKDPERLEALFAVAFERAPSSRELTVIEAAVAH